METAKKDRDKNIFIETMRNYVNRTGIENLLSWLEDTDFYDAPASTKYHGAYPGGLVAHSMNVFRRLMAKRADMTDGTTLETITVVSLLHDVCKTNFYREKEIKQEHGQQVIRYGYDNKLPIGHGEKSVILIQKHMQLTDEEIIAISWHMGEFDVRAKALSYELSQAWERYPLAFLLHVADMEATWLDERRTMDVPEK